MILKIEGGIFPATFVRCYHKCTFGAMCCGDFVLLVAFFLALLEGGHLETTTFIYEKNARGSKSLQVIYK